MKTLSKLTSWCFALLVAVFLMPSVATAGLPAEDALGVINAATGRSALSEVHFPKWALSGSFDSGFSAGLMRKDLDVAGSIASETGFPAAMLALCQERWAGAVAALGPTVDNTEIHRFIAAKAKG